LLCVWTDGGASVPVDCGESPANQLGDQGQFQRTGGTFGE
jgi:hypothetical protein